MKKLLLTIFLTSAFNSLVFAEDISHETKKAIQNATTDEEKLDIFYSSGKQLKLNNYVLNKKVIVESPHKLSPEQGGQFIPQTDEFIDKYLDFLDEGMTPIEAIMMVHVSPEAIEIIKTHERNKRE